MKKLVATLLLVGSAHVAQAQNQPLFATGALTPGHALVLQQTGTPGSAVTRDGGPALAGNFTEFGITNNGLPLCVRDLAQQHLLCFGALALGGALISYNPIGNGTPLGLSINLNGTNFPFPGAGGGNVVAPVSPFPTAGNLAEWNGGTTAIDSGISVTTINNRVPTLAALEAASTANYPTGVWRNDYAANFGARPLFYFPETGSCAANGRVNNGGSCVDAAAGNSFYSTPGVWHAMDFGADPTGFADAAPPLNAMFALASNHQFVIDPGTYTIRSTFTSPYPLSTGQIGFGLFCTSGSPCSNITVWAYGAQIQTAGSVANIDYSAFAYINNFNWYGGGFVANPDFWPPASEPTGMLMFNITKGRFQDMATIGNWGGSTKNPVLFAADNLTDVVFQNISLPQQGEGFDLAFLKRVGLNDIQCVGAGDNGTGQSSSECFHIEYDANTIANYPALVPFRTTDHVTINAGTNVTGFSNGADIIAGGPYMISGSFYQNLGSAGQGGLGLLIRIETAACCISEFDPPHDITINGNISFNGNASFPTGGIEVDASNRTASEQITNVAITGANINNNFGPGINVLGSFITNLMIGPNIYNNGANQTGPANDTAIVLAGGLDYNIGSFAVAQGANTTLPHGNGFLTIREQNPGSGGGCATNGNDVGTFNLGSGAASLGTSSSGVWVASSSPASGHMGIAFSGGAYTIFNNMGASCTATLNARWLMTGAED